MRPTARVVDDRLVVGDALAIPLAEIDVRASRSSGPGGQHANSAASRVVASFDVAASAALSDRQRAVLGRRLGPRVTAVAQDARGQARNRQLALERLGVRLAGGLRERPRRRPTRPSAGARARRLQAKRRQGERKRDRRRPRHDD